MTEQDLQEIKADCNYGVSRLIAEVRRLQDELDYVKQENEILKEQLKGEEQCE